jgi:dolichyl-phosphate-mannose-protein mannosyltransferase
MRLKLSAKEILLYSAIAGLLIRLILALQPGFKIDVDDWFYWALRLNETGFAKFYSPDIFTDYLPGYLYILSFLAFLKETFNLSDFAFYYILKLPAIISEIGLGILIYFSLKDHSPKKALLAASLVFLTPAFIFNSAVWGQVDGVLTIALFASIFCLVKKRFILSSIFIALAFLIKPQAIAIFPVYLLYLVKNFSFEKVIKLTLPAFCTDVLLSFPFFPNNPFEGLLNRVLATASQYQYNSLFAYNLWGMMGFWIPDTNSLGPLTLQITGFILYGTFWVFLSILYFKKNLNLYALSALACLGFFFLPTKVHERYLYPALVFLIYTIFYYRSTWVNISTHLLLLIHFFNLYYVLIYYNQIYFNMPQLLYSEPIYALLDSKAKLLSLLSTILFLTITYQLTRHEFPKTSQT